MKILLTGANGYIGMRLLPLLLNNGHHVVCAVRSAERLSIDEETKSKIDVVEIDFLQPEEGDALPDDIDIAYYLLHSMSGSTSDFDVLEYRIADNFNRLMADQKRLKQVIFLSGIVNEEELSKHLQSRKQVEDLLYKGDYKLTVLRAGIIVGSGSASFEILRDLCEKLPVMITPKWVKTKCQPIAIRDVLKFLTGVIDQKECFDQSFDISGPDVLSYKDMMRIYAEVRGLKITFITVPVMTPKLSSYWLYFVTATSYKLAINLVDSMTVEVTARDNKLKDILGIESTISYRRAIELAFLKIEQNQVVSSWKDSRIAGRFSKRDLNKYIQVPTYGCLRDYQKTKISDIQSTTEKIWAIGGETGYYYADFLWKIRGVVDKMFGGVGLRRGRTNTEKINPGDALDFWRVLLADRSQPRLLLFAEMKVPGEAWLEFYVDQDGYLHQNATFRPLGLKGRLYWYSMLPFHFFIFKGMLNKIAKAE